ncbi:hypothetical protein CSKR_107041 [Clonorchis sinensis]|uniref:J domain-containing protein n=1 Tax=Clonorchis sinensis TaxID=79923 RepID=A0A8T1MHJ5_CLOSI|nr:hypothetical protein CSKR_107041 [Clonorchis sinensis]
MPSCHATRMKHEGWDTARLSKPGQGKSRGRGRVRTTDIPVRGDDFGQFIQKHLRLLFEDENDVLCIFQIDNVLVRSYLNTGVLMTFQEWRKWAPLMDTALGTEAFGELSVHSYTAEGIFVSPTPVLLWWCCAALPLHIFQSSGDSQVASGRITKPLASDRAQLPHHPDKQGNVEVFKAINEAYSVLSREEFRRTYDQSLATGEPIVHDGPIFRSPHTDYREDYYGAHQFPFGRVRTGSDKRTQPTNRIAAMLCVFAFLSYAFSLMWYSRMSKSKDGIIFFRGYRVHFVPDEQIDKKDS